MVRTALALSGWLSVWVWAFSSEWLRDPRGGLSGAVSVALALGVAFAVVVWTARSDWASCGRWTSALLIAHSLFLQAIVAGPVVGYQHLRPFGDLLEWPRVIVSLGLLAYVLLIVAVIVRKRRGWRDTTLGIAPWRWGVAAGALLLLSATPSADPAFFVAELLVNGSMQLAALGNILLIAIAAPAAGLEDWAARLRRVTETTVGRRAALAGLAFFAVCVAALLAIVSYQRHPHIADEVGYLLQAKYFAAGVVTMPPPPAPEAFHMEMMTITATRWYGIFPPGWPLVLALGFVAGAPWLVNPLLAGLNILLLFALARRLLDHEEAWMATFLLAFSPWHLLISMSYMSHTVVTTAALAAALAVANAKRAGGLAWIPVAGVAVGVVSLVRPLDGVALALVLGVWTLWPADRRAWVQAATLTVCTGLVGGLQLHYNQATAGNPLTFPTGEYMDATHGAGRNALGFGPDRGVGWTGLDPLPGHGPLDVILNADLNLSITNVELFGWPTGSFWLLAVALLLVRPKIIDTALLGASAAVVAVYSLYWFSGGPDFGARYWFLVLLPWIMLTARGWRRLARRAEATVRPDAGSRLAAGIVAATVTALVVFVPWRAADKYFHYRGMQPGIRQLLDHPRFEGALVLVRGETFPDYMSAAVYNEVGFPPTSPAIAWYGSRAIARAAVAAFPSRPVWIVDGPTRTGAGFELAAGPLPAGAADQIE